MWGRNLTDIQLPSNGSAPRNLPPFDDTTVCRAYLVGCCAYDILQGCGSALADCVLCSRLHCETHKAEFAKAQAKADLYYDVDALPLLQSSMRNIDVEISRRKERLSEELMQTGEGAQIVAKKRIIDMKDKKDRLFSEISMLLAQGNVSNSLLKKTFLAKLDGDLSATQAWLASLPTSTVRLRLCDDCGEQMNLCDDEYKIAEHFTSKIHRSVLDLKEKLREMKENSESRRQLANDAPSTGTGSSREGSEKEKRSRSPERKERERDRRRRSRSRSRDRRRSSPSHDRDRDRRRGNDYRDYHRRRW